MGHTYQPLFACLCGTLMVALVAPATAQIPPDAGALRQQIEQGREPAAPRQSALPDLLEPGASPSQPSGMQIQARGFRFVGNTLLDSAQLQDALAPYLNRPLNYNQLQSAVGVVIKRYREAGWLVRAFLPEQDIVEGVVTIQIVEARFGGVQLEETSKPRVDPTRLQAMVQSHQSVGSVLSTDALDRALLLIDDLPGVSASGNLTEGAQAGQTDLLLRVGATPLLSGDATLDNTGSRATGDTRLGLNLALNSPWGRGELLSASLVETEGSDYLRLGATIPVGLDGWRLGLNASSLHYKVLLAEFAALDIKGYSDSVGLEASYPLLRSRLRNLYFSANYDSKSFDNQASGTSSSRYRSGALALGLWGNSFDAFAGGGSNSANLSWTLGQLDLAGSPSQAADTLGARSEGAFSKLRYSLARQQTLTGSLSLYATLSGQWADRNLDSSERFYLGGANGVRAYPSSEAGGASGQMLNLELRQRLGQGFGLSAFYDLGQVRTNADNHFPGAPAINDTQLEGYGLSLDWQGSKGVGLKASWARRVGSHPNPAASGNDQDGSRVLDRWWLSASMPF